MLLGLDVDDTLYLERDYVGSGFQAVAAHFRDQVDSGRFFESCWEAFEAGVRGNTFEVALAACGVQADEAMVLRLRDVYRMHRPSISLCADVPLALTQLATAHPLAVLTDGPSQSQRRKVEALGVRRWTDSVVLTDEYGPAYRKPNILAYRMLEGFFELEAEECVYVADNPLKDFAGPRQLGWRTVRVRRDGALHAGLKTPEFVDAEVGDLSALPSLVQKFCKRLP